MFSAAILNVQVYSYRFCTKGHGLGLASLRGWSPSQACALMLPRDLYAFHSFSRACSWCSGHPRLWEHRPGHQGFGQWGFCSRRRRFWRCSVGHTWWTRANGDFSTGFKFSPWVGIWESKLEYCPSKINLHLKTALWLRLQLNIVKVSICVSVCPHGFINYFETCA